MIAGTDCGFSTFAGFGAVDPEIVWAKLGTPGRGRRNRERASTGMGLKQRLAAGDALLGSFLKTPSPILVEVLASCGLDLLCLDAEHAPFDRAAIDACVLAARAAALPVHRAHPDRGARAHPQRARLRRRRRAAAAHPFGRGSAGGGRGSALWPRRARLCRIVAARRATA